MNVSALVKRWHWNLLVVLAAGATIASASTSARSAESFAANYRVVDSTGAPVQGVRFRACAIKWPSLDCLGVLAEATSDINGMLTLYIPDYLYYRRYVNGGYINVEFIDANHDGLVLLQHRLDRDEPATVFAIFKDVMNIRRLCSAFQPSDTSDRYTILPGQCGMPRNLAHF